MEILPNSYLFILTEQEMLNKKTEKLWNIKLHMTTWLWFWIMWSDWLKCPDCT